MTRAVTGLLAIAALAAAGCGSSGGSSSTSSSSSTAPPAAASSSSSSSSSPAGKTVAIKLANIAFAPKTATVKVGGAVTWTNDDAVTHNVTATKGATFKSGDVGQGGTFTFKPTKPGTISYVCTIHPGMTATLTVVK